MMTQINCTGGVGVAERQEAVDGPVFGQHPCERDRGHALYQAVL